MVNNTTYARLRGTVSELTVIESGGTEIILKSITPQAERWHRLTLDEAAALAEDLKARVARMRKALKSRTV